MWYLVAFLLGVVIGVVGAAIWENRHSPNLQDYDAALPFYGEEEKAEGSGGVVVPSELQGLFAQGYRQTSRKYRWVARIVDMRGLQGVGEEKLDYMRRMGGPNVHKLCLTKVEFAEYRRDHDEHFKRLLKEYRDKKLNRGGE